MRGWQFKDQEIIFFQLLPTSTAIIKFFWNFKDILRKQPDRYVPTQ